MPSFAGVRRAITAVTLFAAFASAQTCWFPDGKTQSSDIPCDTSESESACCSSQSLCIKGGFCFTGGVVTRGSCTDKTWGSSACADYCRTVSEEGEIAITPCSSGVSTNTFVCGLDSSDCQSTSKVFSLSALTSLVLRPSQVKQLVGPALAAASANAAGSTATVIRTPEAGDGWYTSGQVAGVGIGVALPLLIALGVAIYLLLREKRKIGSHRSMYQLPDHETKSNFTLQPPPSVRAGLEHRMSAGSQDSRISSRSRDRRPSLRSMNSMSSQVGSIHIGSQIGSQRVSHQPGKYRPSHIGSLNERVESMNIAPQAVRLESTKATPQVVEIHQPRHELDSGPCTPASGPITPKSPQRELEPRYELASQRMST